MRRCFVGLLLSLLTSNTLLAQSEGRITRSTEVRRATDPGVLEAVGIDPSLVNAAQFRILGQLSPEGLKAAMSGKDPASISTMNGRNLSEVEAGAVGDLNDQLVFKPLTPCRVIDTRNAVGAFGPGVQRNYNLIGATNYAAYGGYAGSCGIPTSYISAGLFLRANQVRALVLNVVAVAPTGTGWYRAWPTNLSVPNASVINYQNQSAVANGLTLQTCNASCNFLSNSSCDPCSSGDLSFLNEGSWSHLVVDVLGYMEPGEIPASTEGIRDSSSSLSSTCMVLTSCVATNTANLERGVSVSGNANIDIYHITSTLDTFRMNISTSQTGCSSGFAQAGESIFQVPAAYPTANQQHSTGTSRRFTLAPLSSTTFYLVGRMESGASDWVDGASLGCFVSP